jgi:D-alanyl-D-alanine dipeptidase
MTDQHLTLSFGLSPNVLALLQLSFESLNTRECGEPHREIPAEIFRFSPHAYQSVGAPYSKYSPFSVRETVATKLTSVTRELREHGLALKFFDGYRPLAVQQFMVERTFQEFRDAERNAGEPDEEIWEQVFTLWARPNHDPLYPPPHSTGGAVDVTLVDTLNPVIHQRRALLAATMSDAGFAPLLHEWWHFSYGDRHWAVATGATAAIYGRVE